MQIRNESVLACAALLSLSLASCANATQPDETMVVASGVDLGPSSRVPRTQMAMAGAGYAVAPPRAGGVVQPVRDDGSVARATGTVNKVDAAAHTVNLSHNPIPAIGWPAMTMDFGVAPSVDLSRLKSGGKVNFTLGKDKAGMYQIQRIEPAGDGR